MCFIFHRGDENCRHVKILVEKYEGVASGLD
jgi:hypothetical protein